MLSTLEKISCDRRLHRLLILAASFGLLAACETPTPLASDPPPDGGSVGQDGGAVGSDTGDSGGSSDTGGEGGTDSGGSGGSDGTTGDGGGSGTDGGGTDGGGDGGSGDTGGSGTDGGGTTSSGGTSGDGGTDGGTTTGGGTDTTTGGDTGGTTDGGTTTGGDTGGSDSDGGSTDGGGATTGGSDGGGATTDGTSGGDTGGVGPVILGEDLSGSQVFPASNWWNLDVSSAPIDPNSQAIIDWISGRNSNPSAIRKLHPDFGPPPYGMPYVTVSGGQPLVQVEFVLYGSESDAGAPGGPPGYPIPDEAKTQPSYIEGGQPGGGTSGDRHLLLIDRDNWILFETWATRWNASAGRWEAGSGAVFDMNTNDRRPEGWTSADAAGLAIFPGLIRYDEVFGSGEIEHAFRFTTRSTNGYVWPASHQAGSTSGAPPMGARLRLKASVDISGFPPEIQKIFRAMKRYGLILADNGSDMFIQGTMDARWNNDVLNPAFRSLTADDFEVIELGWRP